MKISSLATIAGLLLVAGSVGAEPMVQSNISLRNEVDHAIDKGVTWLKKNQDTNGFWSTAEQPAITALALAALKGQSANSDAAAQKGYAYIMSCVQPDGGIYSNGLANYNTSVVLTSLVLGDSTPFRQVIVNARKFLVGLQITDDQPGNTNGARTGGFGYGIPKDKRPDLASTAQVLEALYYTKTFVNDKNSSAAPDLNWAAAIHFIESCQNHAADDPQGKGGFTYTPDSSPAGKTNLASGRVALRAYGSISYSGLLSYIYADLQPGDPRVAGVMNWLRGNFTVDENPGMGQAGLYYYYFVMAKALTLCHADTIETSDGRTINWREQLALKLMNLQHPDGSWANDNGRWWEKDPILDTDYGLLTMEIIERKL